MSVLNGQARPGMGMIWMPWEAFFQCHIQPDHRQSHEKVFYREETGLENIASARCWWWGGRSQGRVLKLHFHLFRVEVRILLLLLLLRCSMGWDFWFLFYFTLTQYDVGNLTSTKIKFICSLLRNRQCLLAVQSWVRSYSVVGCFGGKRTETFC